LRLGETGWLHLSRFPMAIFSGLEGTGNEGVLADRRTVPQEGAPVKRTYTVGSFHPPKNRLRFMPDRRHD